MSELNLFNTNQANNNGDYALYYNCIRIIVQLWAVDETSQITSYCMNEFTPNYHIQSNDVIYPHFTFIELSEKNITIEQLSDWSVPIDLIERYQYYLEQLSTSNNQMMDQEIIYECPSYRFGPMCQYELENLYSYPFLSSYIFLSYNTNRDTSNSLSCYIHIKCNRGPYPLCLDWTEVCDGKFDCLDGPFDEEHCTQIDNDYEIHKSTLKIDGFPDNLLGYPPIVYLEDVKCHESPLTSSCTKSRQKQLFEAMFSIKDNSTTDNCWSAFKCILPISISLGSICNSFCSNDNCLEIIEDECPSMFYIPIIPILFTNIYFAYEKLDSKMFNHGLFQHPYICYNDSRYDKYFTNESVLLFHSRKCFRYKTSNTNHIFDLKYLQLIYNTFKSYNQFSSSYQKTSIDLHIQSLQASIISDKDYLEVLCVPDDSLPWIRDEISLIHDGDYMYYSCLYDENKIQHKRPILFQYICDKYNELLPRIINQTDETDCDHWPCNTIYTRCDNFWHCLNGEDELNCDRFPLLQCSSNEHLCISIQTNEMICLSMKNINDKKIDCLGAYDEPLLCNKISRHNTNNYYSLKNGFGTCINFIDLCCDMKYLLDGKICLELTNISNNLQYQRKIQTFLCNSFSYENIRLKLFWLHPLTNDLSKKMSIAKTPTNKLIKVTNENRCHQGLHLRIWLNNNLSNLTCLCPVNYYGEQCQYQNQRISLIIKTIETSLDSRQIQFEIILLLIDDSYERIIHSYEQMSYLFVRNCQQQYHHYLFYSTRQNNQTKNYAIHIDIYEKNSFIYRGSLLYPIINSILPIYRLEFLINIPPNNFQIEYCSKHQCIHGKCVKYINTRSDFCQCYSGWSGKYCNIPLNINCNCSSDSKCVGIDFSSQSICICQAHKFGPRCFLTNRICEKKCQNHGQCIPNDPHGIVLNTKYICICPEGFSGVHCEIKDYEVHLSFDKNLNFLQTIFIHFIETSLSFQPNRTTIFKTIYSTNNSIIIYWSHIYHLIFIEDFKKNYYLIATQTNDTIFKKVQSKDRCQHINELFNKTIVSLNVLQRMKYYYFPCENLSLNLSCFYDDIHLCFCYNYNQQQLTDCFLFNHTMKSNCLGQNECLNNGQCFQSGYNCKKKSTCLCRSCFYGRRCQFTTSGLGLSLDNILGYHIQPLNNLTNQLIIIKISIILNLIFNLAGFINGILTMITFKNKILREIGCGLYLLGSSITTLIIIILFALKFWILIFAQMSSISNRLFLKIQCISLDYLLRVFLHIDQWLNACVACERAITILQGIHFDKRKSKQIAKLVIVILIIFNICVFIHEPIHRHLIDEQNEDGNDKRIWCVVTYSTNLHIYNSIINTIQFFVPFMINFISALILITKKSRQQSNIETKRNFKEILHENYRQYKHLFISPVILVILALPRLIISYVSKCMKSSNDSWLFLCGYFISFIPAMLTFIIFVLPSKYYKKEFHKSINQYKTIVRQRLHISS
ncbi:unnamed protein product [Adineta ricciae]|uniref:Uncharacterized protein n=1 Tax=Adineta ricciae TaxID=249248 RepID=A0A815VU86_ADIRI|nr:unnamed protein product [Adineta ricciae]